MLHQPPESGPSGLATMPLTAEGTLASLRHIRGALHATDAVHQAPGGKAMTALWTDSFTDRQLALGLPPPSELPPNELQAAAEAFLTTADAELLASTGSLLVRNGSLVATTWKVLFDGYDAEVMVRLRSSLKVAGVAPSAFAFSANDIYYEQDAGLLAYTRQSLFMVFGAVLGAVWLLTLSGSFVCLMGACTLSCVAHLIGWMVLVGIKLRCACFRIPLHAYKSPNIRGQPLSSPPLARFSALAQLHLDGAAAPLGRPLHRLLHAHCPCVHRGARHRARACTRGAARARLGRSQRGCQLGPLGPAAGLWQVGHLHDLFLARWNGRRTRIRIRPVPDLSVPPPSRRLLLGVVVVGLFHALLVLPACLSLLPSLQPAHHQDEIGRDSAQPAVNVSSPHLELAQIGDYSTSSEEQGNLVRPNIRL